MSQQQMLDATRPPQSATLPSSPEASRKQILKWEWIGFIFVGLVGAALHFTYELSDYSYPVAFFSAVNESTWEHLKMVYWPGLLFAILQYTYVKDHANNFFLSMVAYLFIMPAVIVIGWYAYAPAVGRSIFLVDISLFYVAVAIGQYLSYRLKIAQPIENPKIKAGAWACFFVMLFAFSTFTYYPPEIFLFEHLDLNDTQLYGILSADVYEQIRIFR
ncbi:MAG: DUF6512 family protein [Chloroflexota bacterium]